MAFEVIAPLAFEGLDTAFGTPAFSGRFAPGTGLTAVISRPELSISIGESARSKSITRWAAAPEIGFVPVLVSLGKFDEWLGDLGAIVAVLAKGRY